MEEHTVVARVRVAGVDEVAPQRVGDECLLRQADADPVQTVVESRPIEARLQLQLR